METLRCPAAFPVLALALVLPAAAAGFDAGRRPVPSMHPRLLGTLDELRELAKQRPEAYGRVKAVCDEKDVPDHQRLISLALVSAIEDDAGLARAAIGIVNACVDNGVRRGHVPFGHDLALGGFVFDLCHRHWTVAEREAFVAHLNATAEANEDYGASVFHNGWWGYKNWGLGVAAYATFHENEKARAILATIERDYLARAAPALQLAGAGGGWAEGYYIHYFLYEWLLFCEVARRSEGLDYHAPAPEFYRKRAVASMFEMYPGIGDYNSRRPVPMGDGGLVFGGDRDKALAARRILVNRHRDDPDHQAVHAYNEQTPRCSVGVNAYKDFLWRDASVPVGDLGDFRLSHHSTGAGHIHARSDWSDEATYFFFKASDRFTSHQHLDAGHFLIHHRGELAGDGGHYDAFGSAHDVNYHLRTIAHNTILVRDPDETWPAIRGGEVTGNDGGQHHAFPHHNGAVDDPRQWLEQRRLYDLADILDFTDEGTYLHVAADLTRAYAAGKLERFTRQIVYLRPSTFVIFDRIIAVDPAFQKSWVLHTMAEPVRSGEYLVVTHGEGRLFLQALLPEKSEIRIHSGDDLYRYDGSHFPSSRDTGPVPKARLHILPAEPAREHRFLNVLHATGAGVDKIDAAVLHLDENHANVTVNGRRVAFALDGAPSVSIETR